MSGTIIDDGPPSTHELCMPLFLEFRHRLTAINIPLRYTVLPDGPPDEMVIFKSSDNILFHVRRRYLEANTGGFPGPELPTYGEIVELSETSQALAILFQFIPPSRHPLLEDVQFPLLGEIAEAAEKYQVFPAMGVVVHRMRFILLQNDWLLRPAFSILNHAVKHGYKTLINEAALNVARLKLSTVAKNLSPNIAPAWLKYRAEWDSVFEKATVFLQSMNLGSTPCIKEWFDPDDGIPTPAICEHCFCLLSTWILNLSTFNGSVAHLTASIEERKMNFTRNVEDILCQACKEMHRPGCMHARELQTRLLHSIANVPPFTTFL